MGLIKKIVSLFSGDKQPQQESKAPNPVPAPAVKQEPEAATLKQEQEKPNPARATTVREIDIYDSIMSTKSAPSADSEVDSTISGILSVLETPDTDNSEELDSDELELRGKIIALCHDILAEQEQSEKMGKVRQLISVSSGLTAITIFTIRLKEMTDY